MQEEIWKDVPNYEGIYQCSNLGNVKSLPRKWSKGEHNGKILKLCRDSRGYLRVALYKDSILKPYTVHQLVAVTFLNHKPNGIKLVIDHINNNKLDNRLENIQIISHRLNCSKDLKNKTSKYNGVYWSKQYNKWHSRIQINKKNNHLGYFNTELEASKAYQNKINEILNK